MCWLGTHFLTVKMDYTALSLLRSQSGERWRSAERNIPWPCHHIESEIMTIDGEDGGWHCGWRGGLETETGAWWQRRNQEIATCSTKLAHHLRNSRALLNIVVGEPIPGYLVLALGHFFAGDQCRAGGGRWLTDDKIAREQLRNRPLMGGTNPDKRSIIWDFGPNRL